MSLLKQVCCSSFVNMKIFLLLSSLLVLHSSVFSHSTDSQNEIYSAATRSDKALHGVKGSITNRYYGMTQNVLPQHTMRRRRPSKGLVAWPNFCPCKKIGTPRGACFEFVDVRSRRCKKVPCKPKYVCLPKDYNGNYGGRAVLKCVKRVSMKQIVFAERKGYYGEKLFCNKLSSRRVFYVPQRRREFYR